MRAGKIEGGIVSQVAIATVGQTLPEGWIELPEGVKIGHAYDGTDFAAPVVEEPAGPTREEFRAYASMPKSEFCIALAEAGVLTEDQAVEAAQGGWPAAFESALTGVSDAERLRARVQWAAARVLERKEPMLAIMAPLAGLDEEGLDALFGYQA